ncbi:MAG: hypothetical protein ABSH53_00010 [Holophaga sp.]|jgi:hypothetical protein
MAPSKTRQRGEGKIGCILSLLVFIVGVALALKLVPVWYSNNNLRAYAADLALEAGVKTIPTMMAQLRSKAKELDIPEALDEGAITVTTLGPSSEGNCTITLNYSRVVDLYGIYPVTFTTNEVINRHYVDAR